LKEIIIIGGGLSGLVSAILLKRAGYAVVLYEKKEYPFQRVCGEYISNEVKPFLEKNKLFPAVFNPSCISKFLLSSINGKCIELDLDYGAFGISRYNFDNFLYKIALEEGVEIFTKVQVECVDFKENYFEVNLASGEVNYASLVIGAYGKRSKLDKVLKRGFIQKRSPYLGVKYHIRTSFDKETVAIHNFKNGYCGLVKIEEDLYNLCYLSSAKNLANCKSIPSMEKEILMKNPFLKDIWESSEFVDEKPEVINEISFETKSPIENHILMAGDSAGMITPLCGNGMAMAIRSASLLSNSVIEHFQPNRFDLGRRKMLEQDYIGKWKNEFENRLRIGRSIQKLYGKSFSSDLLVSFSRLIPSLATFLVSKTHGKYFN
jgi:menaquinone-9 beta-reductase